MFMIEPLVINKNTDYDSLIRFINKTTDNDFNYLENREIFYVNNVKSLKHLLRSSCYVYIDSDVNGYCGIALLWRPKNTIRDRYYLKIKANSHKSARDLITMLSWHVSKEIFARFRSDNEYLSILKEKGFRVLTSLGEQILLSKKPNKELFNVRNNHFSRNGDTLQDKRHFTDKE